MLTPKRCQPGRDLVDDARLVRAVDGQQVVRRGLRRRGVGDTLHGQRQPQPVGGGREGGAGVLRRLARRQPGGQHGGERPMQPRHGRVVQIAAQVIDGPRQRRDDPRPVLPDGRNDNDLAQSLWLLSG